MDIFDFHPADWAVAEVAFDGRYYGPGADLDDMLEDYNRRFLEDIPQWAVDAYLDVTNQILADPEVREIVERYQDTILSESAQRVVENQIRAEVVQNALDGQYDDWVAKVEYYEDSSQAWEDYNGFEDPYLDWWADDFFWRDESPSWWGDDYGLW
ncbi:MAG: hypothetical protein AAF919_02875 [Pseudomonadota bacterium]